MIRFLHTADWQIGTQFGQFEADEAAHLTEARYETVRRIAGEAAARHVDMVLVAGDVFDQQTVSDTAIRRLFGALSDFAGPWVLLPGNHDAALAESVWTRAQRLGCVSANVHVVTQPSVVSFDALRCALLCAPLTQRTTYDDTTLFFDQAATPPEYFRIGLAHGSVTGILPEGVDSTNPIDASRARTARLDYLALGDWHGHLQVDARTWYAGTHEQDRFRTNEPGFVLDVSLPAPGETPLVTPLPVGKYRWHKWDEALAVDSDIEALAARLAALGAGDVLKLAVTGAADLAAVERMRLAVDEARARVRALRFDASDLGVRPSEADLAALGAQGGYLGKVVERLSALQSDAAQASVAAEALVLLAQFQREAKPA